MNGDKLQQPWLREVTDRKNSSELKTRQFFYGHNSESGETHLVNIGEEIKNALPDIQKKLQELSEQKILSLSSENLKECQEQAEQIVKYLDQFDNELKKTIQRLEQKDPETRKWEMLNKLGTSVITSQEDPRSGLESLDLPKMQASLSGLSRRARGHASRFATGIEKQGQLQRPLKKDIGTKVFEIARIDNTESAEHEMQTEKLERGEARDLFARMVSDRGAVVSDIDHTLIDSTQRDKVKVMPKGFIESAERLVNSGIPIGIVTGRTIRSVIESLQNGGATQALIDKLEIYGEYGSTYKGPSIDEMKASDKRAEIYANLVKEVIDTIERRISEDHELKEFAKIEKGGQLLIRINRKSVGGTVKCNSRNLRRYLEEQIWHGTHINVEETVKSVNKKLSYIIDNTLKEKEDYKAFMMDNNSTGIEIRLNAHTKGAAVASLVKRLQLKSVVFYGDDMPDLDVPKALLKFIAVNKDIDGYISDAERGKRHELLKKAISSLTPEGESLAPMENDIQARIEQYPLRNQLNEEFLSLHKNTLQSQAFVGVKRSQGTEAAITEASTFMVEGPDDTVAFIGEVTDEIMKMRKNQSDFRIREYEAQSDKQVGDQRVLARVNRLLHMQGPSELRNAYWGKREKPAKKFAKKHGVSVEEYNQMCEQRVKKLVEGAKLWTRKKLEIFTTILESGRIKTCFETHNSDVPWVNGTENYLAIRIQTEKQMFGYDPETNPQDRPVYGYLSHSPDGVDLHKDRRLDIYGPVAIRLKESLRERTSFTLSGSRSANVSGTEVNLVPCPLEQPSFCAYFYNKDLLEIHSIEDLPRYAEGQVHGGVLVSDIEEIVFHQDVELDDQLIRLLREHTIPYRVVPLLAAGSEIQEKREAGMEHPSVSSQKFGAASLVNP